MAPSEFDLLERILPGRAIIHDASLWEGMLEIPSKFWKSNGDQWAVFFADGDMISQVKIESLKKAREISYKPLVIVTEHSQLSAIAKCYVQTRPYVICRIAGDVQLIHPPEIAIPILRIKKMTKYRPRISLGLLRNIAKGKNLPGTLRRGIKNLIRGYERLEGSRAKKGDDEEQKILEGFGNSVLRNMGFTATRLRAPTTIRAIELSKLVTDRDHYFHSFQNYFLGLLAIDRLKNYFESWKSITRLNWEIDPFDVWFLTALWHDVGHGIQNFPELSAIIFDTAESVQYAESVKYQHLGLPESRIALQDISSVIPRLLEPKGYRTTWVRQNQNTRPTRIQKEIIKALKKNFVTGHGAASAIQLHRSLIEKVNRMRDDSRRELLFQTILFACCSIPFHDWRFREELRKIVGSCWIRNDVMPFGAMLAFIDSIQEDRRELSDIQTWIKFLEKLIIKLPRYVRAKVNLRALSDDDIFWKVIEARDVHATLREGQDTVSFIYPQWMVN